MSFSFDAGNTRHSMSAAASEGMRDAWVSGIRDSLPEGAPESRFYKAAADQIINDIWSKKSAIGVRRAFWNRIDLIRSMGNAHVRDHDRIISEFAERLSMLAEFPEPAEAEPGDRDLCGTEAVTTEPPKEKTYNGF